jgi:hypothetical protein
MAGPENEEMPTVSMTDDDDGDRISNLSTHSEGTIAFFLEPFVFIYCHVLVTNVTASLSLSFVNEKKTCVERTL